MTTTASPRRDCAAVVRRDPFRVLVRSTGARGAAPAGGSLGAAPRAPRPPLSVGRGRAGSMSQPGLGLVTNNVATDIF